jgi:hypothetical protein
VGADDVLRNVIRVKSILYGLCAHVLACACALVLIRVCKESELAQEREEVPVLTPISTSISTQTPRATDVELCRCVEDDRSVASEDIVEQG